MEIPAVGSPQIQQEPLTGGTEIMGQDDFLLLLVTQLSNQDPLNPMDGQEFAAQLAQFSSLEQLIGLNEGVAQNGELSSLLAQGVNSGVAAGLIGRSIEAYGNEFEFAGDDVGLNYELGGVAENVTIEIKNELGSTIRTIELSALPEGNNEFVWDGKNDNGDTVAQGNYSFHVKATDANGGSIEATTVLKGLVDRVTFGREGILLWIGDTPINMGDVRSVSKGTE